MSKSIQKYTDQTVNRFSKTNLYYESNPYLIYQDPTMLGFKILFHWDEPGLLDRNGGDNSALKYLESIGEDVRRVYLEKFLTHLHEMNTRVPWFFQSIDGLNEAWKRDLSKPSHSELPKITIECLESVDLRMTALMDLYRKACFDHHNFREVVPRNLREFRVSIYVYDNRDFKRTLSETDKKSDNIQNKEKQILSLFGSDPTLRDNGQRESQHGTDYINPNINRNLFEFEFCEFDPNESNVHLTSVSNKEMTAATQKISWTYKYVEEKNVYNAYITGEVSDVVIKGLDASSFDPPEGYTINSPLNPDGRSMHPLADKLKTDLENFGKQLAGGPLGTFATLQNQFRPSALVERGVGAVKGSISDQIARLFLGNVYSGIPNNITKAFSGTNNVGEGNSAQNNSKDKSPESIDPGNSLSNG